MRCASRNNLLSLIIAMMMRVQLGGEVAMVIAPGDLRSLLPRLGRGEGGSCLLEGSIASDRTI